MSLLIRNARIITASDDFPGDILVEKDKISAIGHNLAGVDVEREIDARGCLVFPGGVDPHTHLDLPVAPGVVSADDFESGTRAAAFGGTTTIIDMPTQTRGDSMFHALDEWFHKAEGKACIDYAFHMIVTDLPDSRLPEMRRLVSEGIPSFKMFTAYPDRLYVDDATLYRAMCEAGQIGAVVLMHAENGIVIDEIVKRALAEGKTGPAWHARTRPPEMEAEAVHRCIAIARITSCPLYIVHLSSVEALEQVNFARDNGLPVCAETCPQYLFLDDSLYERPGFEGAKWVMTPALRPKEYQEVLWAGLRRNQLQTVATDHCPFCMNDKRRGENDFTKIPNGIPGIENRMTLIFTGGPGAGMMSLNRFVEITSTNAAKIFGLYPRKGTIAIGSDADLVIYDPDKVDTISVANPQTHHMNVDYSAFEGIRVRGKVETVVARGKVIVEKGQFSGRAGAGEFLKREPYNEQTWP